MITAYCSLTWRCSAERISYSFENLWLDKSIHNELCFTPWQDLQSEWDQLRSKCVRIQFSTKECVGTIRTCESDLSAPKCKHMGNKMCQDYTMVWEYRSLRHAIYYKVHDKTPESSNYTLPGCWLITAAGESCSLEKNSTCTSQNSAGKLFHNQLRDRKTELIHATPECLGHWQMSQAV